MATYGTSANGTEGPSKINNLNLNLFSSISPTKLSEAHFGYSRESRPRSATPSNLLADTAMGFGPTFRFGNPFFLQPNVDELIWRTHAKENFSIITGPHTIKFGGEWIHTLNDQVFRGFLHRSLSVRQRNGIPALRFACRAGRFRPANSRLLKWNICYASGDLSGRHYDDRRPAVVLFAGRHSERLVGRAAAGRVQHQE